MTATGRIYINGRFLTQRRTGVQRFAMEVLRAVDALAGEGGPAAQAVLLTPRGIVKPEGIAHLAHRAGGRFAGGYGWEQLDLPRLASDGVLLNLGGLAPLAKRRQVVVMHDASPKAVPQAFSRPFRLAYGVLVPATGRIAARLATVSEFSRAEIARWYGIPAERFAICHEGGEHILDQPADAGVLARNGLRPGGYFLAVGMGAKNKNLPAILDAYARAAPQGIGLALTGARSSRVHGEDGPALPEGVTHCGFVSDAELRALYEGACALVYPSSYEGFGLPVVEAMNCGCPVVASNQPALQEVAGDAALIVPLGDAAALASALSRIAAEPGLREMLAARGRARVARFTWRATARILLDLCGAAAR